MRKPHAWGRSGVRFLMWRLPLHFPRQKTLGYWERPTRMPLPQAISSSTKISGIIQRCLQPSGLFNAGERAPSIAVIAQDGRKAPSPDTSFHFSVWVPPSVALSRQWLLTRDQLAWLHNLWDPMQKESVEPLVQKNREKSAIVELNYSFFLLFQSLLQLVTVFFICYLMPCQVKKTKF